MMSHERIQRLVIGALLAALTCVATLAIQIPTPLHGYVHLGDSFVLLSGIILGPVGGALAGGLGSMMADLLTGYVVYAPATFIIKMLAAFAGGLIFHRMVNNKKRSKNSYFALIIAGIAGGVAVTGGYFIYESILYGAAASGANAIFNVFQNIVGIVAAFVLMPILQQVPNIKKWMKNPAF